MPSGERKHLSEPFEPAERKTNRLKRKDLRSACVSKSQVKKIDFLAQIVYNRISNGAVMISTAPFFDSGGHIMKTIGVIPLIDYGRKSYWMIPGYLNGLQTVGALPIMLPVIERVSFKLL